MSGLPPSGSFPNVSSGFRGGRLTSRLTRPLCGIPFRTVYRDRYRSGQGDRLGRRRVFRTGLVLFSLGSLLSSVAPALGWLVGFRGRRAAGGIDAPPGGAGHHRQRVPRPAGAGQSAIGVGRRRRRQHGVGSVLGGVLVGSIGARAVVWVNVPIGLVAPALTGRHASESRAAPARELDPPGQALVILALGA